MEELYNQLNKDGKYTKTFEEFQVQFGTPEKSEKLYSALNQAGDYTKSFDDFKVQFNVLPEGVIELTDEQVGKTNDSASADPAVESSQNYLGSNLENGSSESRDASDFKNTQEKDTLIERTFGKNEFTDFVGDIYRAWDAGTEAGSSVDEAFDIYKGKDATDEEVYDFLEKTRNIEDKGQTDEMISASAKMAELKKEGYNGFSAFLGGWWDNPSAMLQYSVMSLSQMGRALFDSEEVAGTALASAGVGAGVGAAAGLAGGPFAPVTSTAGAIAGTVGGFFGGLSGAMEAGMTTAALIQEEAIKEGLDWGSLSDKERFDYVRGIQNDVDKFDDIRSKAVARGLTIGAIDGVVGALSGGIGNAVFDASAKGASSALAQVARVGSVATLETAGGMLSEVAGQAAAEQEFNLEEILIEGFADKTFTGVSLLKATIQGAPKYSINGEKMNGKQFIDNIKSLDDEAFVVTDAIKVENSPAVSKLISDRRQNISADQKVDSRISGVEDRTAAINLVKEQNKLEGNPKGNKIRLKQIQAEIDVIAAKYADSQVDATIEQRKEAVANAVDTAFEASFNKNYKALKDAETDTGIEPVIFEDDNAFAESAAKDLGVTKEYILENAPDGVFVGKGKVYINKAEAKRSIDIATGNNGAISVASHEVLHPIFNALIGGAKSQGQFVNDFKKQMTSKQRDYVNKRLKSAYKNQPGAEAIELMNIFSDGIIKNEINYDQTTFEKLGSTLVNFFRSKLGLTTNEISFDDGRSVFNFLKEYNTSVKAGKLSEEAILAIKKAEEQKGTKVAEASLLQEDQFSKTLSDDVKATLADSITEIKNLAKENAAIAAKFNKEPIKGAKQVRLEREVIEGVKPLVEKIVTNRTKALYDKIADDAKRGVTRDQFQESMRADIETMILNEYDATKQDLEKFTVSRAYLRANDLAKRLGIESVEEGGIKQDIDTAKGVTEEETTTTKPKEPSVERGQATFDELDIVDDALIEDIKNDLEKEIRVRVQKGTLSETVSVKKGRETYIVSWLENYVNKQLFKKLLKKVGAITGVYPNAVIPGAYIDFLNDPKTFDIVTKALPIKSIKKSYGKLFPIERVGRELTAEGNPIFRIKAIDKKTFLTYFVKGKKSAVLERQKQLFREILEPLAKQVVADYATPENLSQLKSIQELAPAESMDIIENIAIDAQLSNLESKLDRYIEEESGFDIIQFSLTKQTAPDQLASIAGLDYKDISLKDSSKGKQKFYIERLEEYYKQREKFMSFLPPSITKFRGLTAAMLGFVYREDGSYYDFYKFNYKKVIDKKGEIVTDKKRLKSLFEKGTAEYKNKLLDKKGDSSKYSKTTKKLLKEVNELIEKANLGRLTPNLHHGRITVAKTELDPTVTESTAKEVLDHLSKNNELNAKIAELYISLLRDFVKNSNNKEQAKSTVVNMLLATNNTVNGWRSLAAITSIIYNKNKSVDYYFEHNDSMRSALPNILRQILGDGTISFRVDASLIPKSLAKEKNKNQKTKIGNRSVTDTFYKKALKENKDLKIVTGQFSLNSNTNIEFIESQFLKSTKTTVFEIYGIQYVGSMTGFDNVRGNMFEGEALIDKLKQVTGNKNVETNKYQAFAFDRSDAGAEVVSRDSAEWNGKRYVFPESDTKQSLAVFGSLSNYFLNEIKKGNIDGLVFSGVEASRKRLYQTLSERFSKQLGWNFDMLEASDNRGGNTYFIAKPAQQAEVRAEMKNANLIQFSKTLSKAKAMVNRPDAPQKGISVWDFDDTLATTKSNVLYTMPDGTKGKIDATQFAAKGDQLAAKGAEFDFSEFKKVMEGAKGPMFNKAVARNKKFGNDNVFILTARPADSKYAIHDFLSAIGLDIKLENIFGLGDGTAIAKAKWVIGKVAEGYNDFYFADDAYKNVKAVQEVLEEADVKSKVHQAKVQFSKNLSKEFNNIIEDVTGIESFKAFSEAKGKVRGQGKGKYKFFIPPSADDFAGLLYKLTGKGKTGEAQQAWFKEALFDPFAKAMREFESYKQNVTGIVKQLKKDIKNVPSGLKKVNETGFTNEVAVRVYLWAKNGYDINGLSETDKKELIAIVEANKDLLDFAGQMDSVLEGYPEPQNDWLAGTITTDAINMINTVKRAEFLEAWQNNADAIFTKENFNKLRAAFGDNYVEAMQDMLYRMKTGRNRPSGANKLTNKFMNWVNDSVGTIMFFNTRSALLQTLSIVNFINWGDNNPMAAAKAFANQKQFWSDFSMLFNSDFLKQRRSGLKNDVNADDIANAAETATNKTKAVLSSLLKMGFLPTQIADSFAIAMGGASFVRNRINKYVSEGMDKQAAEEQAFLDFQEVAEETQQSSRPDRVSQQQASPLGRIILAFANTPMQYMRLTKKAFLDLKNGRGDAKTNITKIAYYMAVQNIIFSSLQAALFAGLFDDDEEALDNKQTRVANSMLDSILRGVGVYGAIASTLKNIFIEIKTQAEKDRPDFTIAAQRALSISPPIDSKMRKLMGAGRAFSYKTTREKMVGYGLDNPAFYAGGQIVSALTNVPLDRAIRKADNLRVAVDNDTKYWQSLALFLGYSQWDLGLVETSKSKGKSKKKNNFGTTSNWKRKVKGDGGWKKRN